MYKWAPVLLLLFLKPSEETCQFLTKTSMRFNNPLLRDTYKYISCNGLTTDSNLRSEILAATNATTVPNIEITNSSILEINQDVFQSMNLFQLKIEANIQIIQDKTFANTNISTIILDNNLIQKLKENCFSSTSISVLSLRNNSLDAITVKYFTGLLNLRKLILQSNRIVDIQSFSFKDLQSLEELDLSYNRLQYLPDGVFRTMKYIQTIYLNNNRFKKINSELLEENVLLNFLHLQNNNINYLNATLFPKSLVMISVENNELTSVNVSGLVNLYKLVLNSNKLTTIKNCLLNLPSLAYLHLNHNFLGPNLNESFGHPNNLSIIEIDDNKIIHFDFGVLRNLKLFYGISLAKNNISFLDFSQLNVSIKHINLTSNSLKQIQNFSNIKNLEKLELSYNNFEEISYELLEGLTFLRYLWLNNNVIKTLARGCFRDLKSLLELNLSHNNIKIISSSVFNGLYLLGTLDISYNNISDIDEDLFHTTKTLKLLNIAYNNLSNINVKQILLHTMWLREINLNGNQWSCKDLINIVRDTRGITLTSGNFYNISNVYGIPCNETEEKENTFDTIQFYRDVLNIFNSTSMETVKISSKLNIVNVLLTLVLLVVCGKLAYDKYHRKIVATSQFVYRKSASEQEIQLVG